MKNYHIHLNDLPRSLNSPLPLSALVSYDNAMGTWNGKRGNVMEFAIRLSSPDPRSVDIQNGVETRMPFPHVYLKYPGSDFHSPPFAPRAAFALLYDGSLTGRFGECGISCGPVTWALEITGEIRELIHKIDLLCEKVSVPGSIDRIDFLALCLLREVMLQQPRKEPETDPFYTERLQRIASYLRCHYAERIDLNVLAAKHGFSRRTFFRYWSRIFPCPPGEYLLNLRMREARRLLHSEMPVSEIALRLNFPDPSYFTEQFRKHFGETPREYRKRCT